MKTLNLPGKTGTWFTIEHATAIQQNMTTMVTRKPRIEREKWRVTKQTHAVKRKQRKADKWMSKYM